MKFKLLQAYMDQLATLSNCTNPYQATAEYNKLMGVIMAMEYSGLFEGEELLVYVIEAGKHTPEVF